MYQCRSTYVHAFPVFLEVGTSIYQVVGLGERPHKDTSLVVWCMGNYVRHKVVNRQFTGLNPWLLEEQKPFLAKGDQVKDTTSTLPKDL